MNPTLGMNVRDVRDLRVGEVTGIANACISVREAAICISAEAVASVDDEGVALICNREELRRYECRVHPRQLSRPGR